MVAPNYETHYLCPWESSYQRRKWIPKEKAIMRGKKPYCPDCGRKLRTSPKRNLKRKDKRGRKFSKKKRKPWEIVMDRKELPPLNLRAYRKCPHCKVEMRYMKEMEKKGRIGVFECRRCKCIFCWTTVLAKKIFVLVRKNPKCHTLRGKKNDALYS